VIFQSGPASFDVALDELGGEQMVIDAGGVGRFVKVGPALRDDAPQAFQGSWIDESPISGVTPYWLRAIQVDQAVAWSSPVYVQH
jgi:hypothetical protein